MKVDNIQTHISNILFYCQMDLFVSSQFASLNVQYSFALNIPKFMYRNIFHSLQINRAINSIFHNCYFIWIMMWHESEFLNLK